MVTRSLRDRRGVPLAKSENQLDFAARQTGFTRDPFGRQAEVAARPDFPKSAFKIVGTRKAAWKLLDRDVRDFDQTRAKYGRSPEYGLRSSFLIK